MQTKNSVGGFSFSYGVQYDIPLNSKTSIVLGYSGVFILFYIFNKIFCGNTV